MTIVLIIILIISIIGFIFGIQEIILGIKSKNWMKINVEITKSQVLEERIGTGKTWTPEVEYKFIHDNQEILCTEPNFKKLNCSSPHDSEQFIKKYKVGSIHEAYLNEKKPEKSVLETGISQSGYGYTIISIIIFTFILIKLITQ